MSGLPEQHGRRQFSHRVGNRKLGEMMATCEALLWDLARRIEPTSAQKTGAKKSQNFLRDVLRSGKMEERIIDHYLSGSYSRDTAIRPLDDVDIIFIIDPTKWTGSGLLASFIRPDPEQVLKSFARAIRYRYRDSPVIQQRRSVRLALYHLDIDVVPAIADRSDSRAIWIPDRNSGSWIKSAPLKHKQNATDVNSRQGNRFKPLVKLLKHWNGNLPSTAHLKSFAIETMAVRLFQNVAFETLEEGLLVFFDFISQFDRKAEVYRWLNDYDMSLRWLNCSIPDAAGTGANVVAGMDEDRRKRFLEHSIRSRDYMLEANKSRSLSAARKKLAKALRTPL